MQKIVITVISVLLLYAISWAITVGVIKLITICFGAGFSLAIATGIWLALCLLRWLFSGESSKK